MLCSMDEQQRRDEWIEAGMDAEADTGKPLHATTADNIKEWQARIELLERRLKEIHPDADPLPLQRDLAQAKRRLAEYQTQHEGRN